MIKLYNNDCFVILPTIANTVANPIIVSDPPFNIGYHYNTYNDRLNEDEYYKRMYEVFHSLPCVIIHYPEQLYKIALTIHRVPTKVISWVYNSNTGKQHRDIAFFDIKPDMSKIRQPYKNPNDKRIKERIARGCKGAKLYDWWNINQVKNVSKEKTVHPCQMPLEVMNNVIGILPDKYTIIDPFMGSGTTGVACIDNEQDFIGIEIDKQYFDIAEQRLLKERSDNIDALLRNKKGVNT